MGLASFICGMTATAGNIAAWLIFTLRVIDASNHYSSYNNYYTHAYDDYLLEIISSARTLAVVVLLCAAAGVVLGVLGIIQNAKQKKKLGLSITGLVSSGAALLLIVFLLIAFSVIAAEL